MHKIKCTKCPIGSCQVKSCWIKWHTVLFLIGSALTWLHPYQFIWVTEISLKGKSVTSATSTTVPRGRDHSPHVHTAGVVPWCLLALFRFPTFLVRVFLDLSRSSLTWEETWNHVPQPVQKKKPIKTLSFKAPFTVGWVYEILTLLTEAQHEIPAPSTLALGHSHRTKILWELGPAPALLRTKLKACWSQWECNWPLKYRSRPYTTRQTRSFCATCHHYQAPIGRKTEKPWKWACMSNSSSEIVLRFIKEQGRSQSG